MARTELRTRRDGPRVKPPSQQRADGNRQQQRNGSTQTGASQSSQSRRLGFSASDLYAEASQAADGRRNRANKAEGPRRTNMERIQRALAGKYGEKTEKATKTLQRQIAKLPEALQSSFMNALGEDPRRADDLLAILNSKTWTGEAGDKSLTDEQKRQVAELVSYAGTRGIASLAKLVNEPEKLASKDLATGRTLLQNLLTLAKQPMNPALLEAGKFDAKHGDWEKGSRSMRTALVDDVIRESTRLSTVDQGNANTCSSTSIQQGLIRENPAEFARLMAGLASKSGKVKMAGGASLALQREGLHPGKNETRGPSSMVFQSALMEMANGKTKYNAAKDTRNDKFRTGLTQSEQVVALQQVFGEKFADFTPKRDKNGNLPPNYLAFATDFLKKHKLADGPVLLSMLSPDKKMSHTVTFLGMTDDGRYLIRDPEGHTKDKVGSKDAWGWKVEGQSGLYSLSKAQLDKYLRGFRAPAESIQENMKDWKPPTSNAPQKPDMGEPEPYELIPIFDMPAIEAAERQANLDFINQFIFGTPDNRIPYEDFLAAQGITPQREPEPYYGYGPTSPDAPTSYPELSYQPFAAEPAYGNNAENQTEEATPAYLYAGLRG